MIGAVVLAPNDWASLHLDAEHGIANTLIARRLNMSEETVKVHVKIILQKLRLSNRAHAAIWAMDRLRPMSPEEAA